MFLDYLKRYPQDIIKYTTGNNYPINWIRFAKVKQHDDKNQMFENFKKRFSDTAVDDFLKYIAVNSETVVELMIRRLISFDKATVIYVLKNVGLAFE